MCDIVNEMVDRNASYSCMGHQFQVAASISIMIDYFDSFTAIRNEGSDDVVLKLDSGTMVFAQAKSTSNPQRSLTGNLKNGLKTLNEDYNNNPDCFLIFITNYLKMFGSKTSIDDFSSGFTIKFKNLNEKNQKLMAKYLSVTDIDTDKIGVQYLKFITDGGEDSYYKLYDKVRDNILRKLPGVYISSNEIVEKWRLNLEDISASKNVNKYLTRKDMIWCLILCIVCHMDYGSLQDDDIFRVQKQYEQFINRHSNRIDVISRIIGDYRLNDYPPIDEYIEMNYDKYLELLSDFDIPDKDKSAILRILIHNVLYKSKYIQEVLGL